MIFIFFCVLNSGIKWSQPGVSSNLTGVLFEETIFNIWLSAVCQGVKGVFLINFLIISVKES